jgi:GPR1/FUN34/yaaH family
MKCIRLPRIATLRKCIAFVVTFGFLAMTFMVLAAAQFTGNAEYVPILLSLFSTHVPDLCQSKQRWTSGWCHRDLHFIHGILRWAERAACRRRAARLQPATRRVLSDRAVA